MGAKRFGVGILVGLLLALAVVASSGFTYGTFGSFSANYVQLPVTSQGTTSTVTAVVTTASMSAFTMYSTTGTSNGGSSPQSSVTSSTTGTEFGPAKNIQNPAPLDALYSSLANRSVAGVQAAPADTLASKPASVAWLVFIPVAVALVLGLVLYRSSTGRLAKD